MKRRKYAIKLLKVLNKQNNTLFRFEDFRSIARYMDKETKTVFKDSGGFSTRGENSLGLVLTSKRNRNLKGLVDTELTEYHLLIGDNHNKADEYAKKNTDKYLKLLKDVLNISKVVVI